MKRLFLFLLLPQVLFFGCSGGSGWGEAAVIRRSSSGNDVVWQGENEESERSFSFAVVGCNRINAADVSEENPSTANLEQLNRTFREIAGLQHLPKFLFFAGDLVLGYSSDVSVTERELIAWRNVFEASPLPEAGVQLVTIPGNHEVQGDDRLAYLAAEEAWLRVMGPYIAGSNGPGPGGPDGLTTDQSSLTYSFDYRGAHFLMLNTDPVDRDWQVPTRWIEADLLAARANGANHIFAIGHKPAFPWPQTPLDGLSRFPKVRDDFWNSMEVTGAEAMFAAHNHLWFKQQPSEGGTWQIIAGNGGACSRRA